MADKDLKKKIEDTLWSILPKYLGINYYYFLVKITREFFEVFEEDD
jgi:hypothetical protein